MVSPNQGQRRELRDLPLRGRLRRIRLPNDNAPEMASRKETTYRGVASRQHQRGTMGRQSCMRKLQSEQASKHLESLFFLDNLEKLTNESCDSSTNGILEFSLNLEADFAFLKSQSIHWNSIGE